MLEDDAAHVRCCIDQVTSFSGAHGGIPHAMAERGLFASTFDEFAFIRGILKMQMTEQSPCLSTERSGMGSIAMSTAKGSEAPASLAWNT